MKKFFKPGCDMMEYDPCAVEAIFVLFKKVYPDIEMYYKCCKQDPELEESAIMVVVCPGCDRRLKSTYSVHHQTKLLWEIINEIEDFPFPNYNGQTMSIQDACNYRQVPQVLDTVRELM